MGVTYTIWCLLLLLGGYCSSSSSSTTSSRLSRFQSSLSRQLLLAPLTRGGNLPFRRLCSDASFFGEETQSRHLGANFTMSEMAFARMLFRGDRNVVRKERALLKKHESEQNFGFQIATKSSEEAIRAIALAEEGGATWVDLNCGCPIYEATRRGLGAELLKRPDSLAKLVGMIVANKETDMPFTVKIRLGPSDSKINVERVVEGLVGAGAAAVTIHGRTMTQRYTRPADWGMISKVGKGGYGIPVIGNGDILTHYEAADRLAMEGVDALMVGRGALIKPWIFAEYSAGREFNPTARQRIGLYHRLATNFKEHFGTDDFGKRHSFYFLPWHFSFFCRYRHLPQDIFHDMSRQAPLIQNSRLVDDYLQTHSSRDSLFPDEPLEKLLRCEDTEVHLQIANILWDAHFPEDAVEALESFAVKNENTVLLSSSSASASKPVSFLNPAASWEIGGAGPRGDANTDVTDVETRPVEANVEKKSRRGELSSRWIPLPLEEHLSVLDFRVGRVLETMGHPSAENLSLNRVDLGDLGTRTIVTGRRAVSPGAAQALEGRDVAVLVSLKPRVLYNVTSDGLILFAHDKSDKEDGGAWGAVFVVDGGSPGQRLVFPGVTQSQATAVSTNRAQRAWKAVSEGALRTQKGFVVFSGLAQENPIPLQLTETPGQCCLSKVTEGLVS